MPGKMKLSKMRLTGCNNLKEYVHTLYTYSIGKTFKHINSLKLNKLFFVLSNSYRKVYLLHTLKRRQHGRQKAAKY